MPDNTNPYMTVGAPSYAQPLMNWQGMANSIAGAFGQPQQQQKPPGQPGAPQGGVSPQAQQQLNGLGQNLLSRFGLGTPPAAAGAPGGGAAPGMGGPPQTGAPQPSMMGMRQPMPPQMTGGAQQPWAQQPMMPWPNT